MELTDIISLKQDILEKLADLHHQATTEKSHYYVGACIREAATEIMRLRELLSSITNAEEYNIKHEKNVEKLKKLYEEIRNE